ncbi:NAD(P)-binding domain-containing protein [Streptomyces sp. NPDC052052]|uniref:NAD(P)-binding domain-containing protein n=1 Tax=Streptomyces sp. NPDC052052 TaxID=3154756 RepID=UPI00343E5EC4
MNVTLVGPGVHGTMIAALLARHGVGVTLYHYKPAKAEAAAAQVRAVAQDPSRVAVENDLHRAAAASDIVVLATLWGEAQRQVIQEIGDELAGRVVVDVSNPLDVTPHGIIRALSPHQSSGAFVAGLLPEGTSHVKVFSSIGPDALAEGADLADPAVLAYGASDARGKKAGAEMVRAVGWRPWFLGDAVRNAVRLEIGGEVNVLRGRRGRLITEAEAEAAFGPEATDI